MTHRPLRVLVTGAGGFIGSHLTEALVQAGHEVTAFVRYTSNGRCGWLEESPHKKNIRFVLGDIVDPDSVASAVQGQDIVFHLAAMIAIPYSYQAPRSYVDVNITGTINVLQAARSVGAKVIHTSTSEVYGTAQFVPITEKHPLVGQSPYSATKIGADAIVESFHRSFGVPTVTVRPFNTYGPRQSPRAVIPTIITQLMQRNQVNLGSLAPTRDLNFVHDTAAGFIAAASHEAAIGQTIQLATNQEISIGDLAQTIARLMGKSADIIQQEQRLRPAASEVERLLGDANKAAELIGWRSSTDLTEGLKQTIDWFISRPQDQRIDQYVT